MPGEHVDFVAVLGDGHGAMFEDLELIVVDVGDEVSGRAHVESLCEVAADCEGARFGFAHFEDAERAMRDDDGIGCGELAIFKEFHD